MSKRAIALLSIVLSLVMLFSLTACGGSTDVDTGANTGGDTGGSDATTSAPAPAGPARSRIVNIGETQRIRSLDPHQAQDTGTMAGINYMYETLIVYARTIEGDGTGPADEVGWLAESWEVDPDMMYWIFYLRQDVDFHNGQHFTADDVVCTFQRLIDRRDELNVAITEWALLDSVEKIDEYTVKVNFSEPYAWAGASFVNTNIIPHEAYEEMGDELWNQQLCYATGPWILEEWVDGQYIHYKKNPNYWNKEHYDPYFDELYHRYIAEPSTGVAAMLSGDLDVLASPGGIDMMMLPQFNGAEDRVELVKRKTILFYYIQFKLDPSNIFADENIRKAFSYAIDRELIVDGVFGGEAYVNDGGFFASGVDGYDKGMTHVYDPDEAKRLLDASAYSGQELSLVTTQSMPKAEEFALAVADLANAVGFNVVVYTEETGVYAERRFGGDYDMYVGYTTLTNVPGGIRRHFNQITTDMYHHGMAENPNLDFGYIQDLINTYYSAKTYQIAYDTALEYNRYTKEHMAPQTDILFLNSTNAQARGIAGMKFTEAGINYFRYIDWDPSLLP